MFGPVVQTVLVTGANGYIGNAVARAFVRAGWTTFGLVRNKGSLNDLAADEIIPLLGSPGDHPFLSTLLPDLTFNVIVSKKPDHELRPAIQRDRLPPHCPGQGKPFQGKSKPLVLFTSGCKDYGMIDLAADSPGLKQPHTEESHIAPPPFAVDRASYVVKIFEHQELFDAVVLRPTNVYGLASSFYGGFFRLAKEGKGKGVWMLNEHPKTILNAMHVDDSGDAYVALAGDEARRRVGGERFNISSHRFETLREITGALAQEYGIKEIKWVPIPEGSADAVFDKGRFLSFHLNFCFEKVLMRS